MRRKSTLLLLVCLIVQTLWAQTPAETVASEPDYNVFSLEELFRVDVITASKQKEPLWDAPGVVTVLTRQEIEKFGGNNLWDLLERLPAVQKNFSGGVISTSVRGGGGFNQAHILMLIDGRPLRTANGNISIYNSYLTFPINMIERIEMVRGPGSTLYGTNAFEGVINIITREGTRNTIEVSTKAGSFNTKAGNAYVHFKKGKFTMDVGTHYYDTDGWDFVSNTDFMGSATNEAGERVPFSKEVFEDNKGLRVNLKYSGLTASVYTGHAKHFAEVFYNSSDAFSWESTVNLYNLGYEKKFNDNYRIEINATRNEEIFNWTLTPHDIPALPFRSRDNLVEATIFGKLSNKFNFMLGGVYQHWDGYNPQGLFANEIDYQKEDHISAYTQFTYRPNRFLKFIAGVQLNKPEEVERDIVPRTGAVINFSPRLGAKLLYGKAFKSPNPSDRFVNTPTFQLGYPDLKSETITTNSIQLFYQGEKEQIVATYFSSTEKDLLQGGPPTAEDYPSFQRFYPNMTLEEFLSYQLVSRNQGELKVDGVELEFKYIPAPNFFLITAMSYQENENGLGIKNITVAPSHLIKLGMGYSSKTISVGLFESHYDNFKDNRIINANALQLNKPSKPFDVVTLNSNYKMKFRSLDMVFELYVFNLLNDEAYVHELPTDVRNTIPGMADRSIYASVKAKY